MKELISQNQESDFTPIILNEDDTEFVKSAVDVVGYRYLEKKSADPLLSWGEKLEITDRNLGVFVAQCLRGRAELSGRLIAAHHANLRRTQARHERLSDDHYNNVRTSVEQSEAIIATAELLLLDLPTIQESVQSA